jgi:heat shock protein HslJ
MVYFVPGLQKAGPEVDGSLPLSWKIAGALRLAQEPRREKVRKRVFTISVVMGLLVAGRLVPAAWADSHGEIVGIQWQWAELTETEPASQSVVPDPENYVMVLNADGTASLKADCNQVQWTYTLEGTSLTFNTLGPSTLAYCGDDSLDQLFLSKLGMGGTVSVEDGRLAIELNENAGRMVFNDGGTVEKAPESMPETGGKSALAPWMVVVLAGLAVLGTGVILNWRKP